MKNPAILPASTFEGAFQLAYVTRDIEKAACVMAERNRLEPFSFHQIDMPCFGRSESCVARVAISWNGARQVELIEPISGAVELYSEGLPPPGTLTAFHHIGTKVQGGIADWEARRDALSDAGFPIALQGGLEDRVRFAYFDMRDTLGHHVELIWLGAPFLTARAAL
jgi:hypothetical protein